MEEIRGEIEDLKNEMEEAAEKKREVFDNRSEKWQESEKGQEYAESLEVIEGHVSTLEDCHNDADNIVNSLYSLSED